MGATASVPRDRTRPLQVIDAGYARTATLSYALALERLLGGPVMHGGTQLFGREDGYCRRLDDLYRLRRAGEAGHAQLLRTLRDVTEGFVGTADCPLLHFLPELLELYPEARVVLVTRDPAGWWRSFGAFTRVDAYRALAVRCLEVFLAPLPGARWFPSITRGFDDEYVFHRGTCTAGMQRVVEDGRPLTSRNNAAYVCDTASRDRRRRSWSCTTRGCAGRCPRSGSSRWTSPAAGSPCASSWTSRCRTSRSRGSTTARPGTSSCGPSCGRPA